MMIKHKNENLFFVNILKARWNIFMGAFILSIVLYGCAAKTGEIRPISYNFEDQNKLKVAVLTNLVIDRDLDDPMSKRYSAIRSKLINAFDKKKFKVVLNPIKREYYWAKKDYYIDAGKKLKVDYIIRIRFEEISSAYAIKINRVIYKIFHIHNGESREKNLFTTTLDADGVANRLFGFFDHFISQQDDY